METVSLQEPKKEPDNRENEPQLVGDYLVNVYSKALQPRRRTVCTACVLRLKRAFKPLEFRGKVYSPIYRLRIFWHTRGEQRIIRLGACRSCGKVYDEQIPRAGTWPHIDSFKGTKNCVSCRSPIIKGGISHGHVHRGSRTLIASFCKVCGELRKPWMVIVRITKCDSPMGCYGEWEEWMGETVI